MTSRKRKWLLGAGAAVVITGGALAVAGFVLAGRIEPYARAQAVEYLSRHFDSDVRMDALHLRVPEFSPLRLLLTRRWGTSARIEGEGLYLKKHGSGTTPMISIRKFTGEVELDSLFHPPIVVSRLTADGMEVQIPPRSARTAPAANVERAGAQEDAGAAKPEIVIQSIDVQHAALTIMPRDSRKIPLRFEIETLHMQSGGASAAMLFDAALHNPKPPGEIHAAGQFGPWLTPDPGDTPLNGNYTFEGADLSVFNGIAGTLHSTGRFQGRLSALTVRGQASVPNFRLRRAGNPMPLTARFDALVDGTNGNTTLQPVAATLGSTYFTARGGIIKHEANQPRAISLDIDMPNGNLRDVLRLCMNQEPFMDGRLKLRTKMDIPPLAGKVREKLILDGNFQLLEGRFHHSTIQNQLDGLSRRAQGNPENQEKEQAIANMAGTFHLEDAWLRFRELSFGIPGARLDMAGDYSLDTDTVDFAGTAKLQATVSQMVTGWKRILLKPVDRFFEKEGAGTFLRIRVSGTSKSPHFGLNFSRP